MYRVERWDEGVQEDHRALSSQVGALEAAITIDVGPEDRRIVLSWIIRNLWAALELHLRKEREVLFAALEQLLGSTAGALTLLKDQHKELQAAHRRLAELLQITENTNWDGVRFAVEWLIDLLDDHERKTNHLLLGVLEYSLKPKDLKALAEAFEQVARRAYEEEGWPKAWWERKPPIVVDDKTLKEDLCGKHLS